MNGSYFKQVICTVLGTILISIGSITWAGPVQADDYYKCFQPDPKIAGCTEKVLVNSCFEPPDDKKASCCKGTKEGDKKDYDIDLVDKKSNVTVLAIHGGYIERYTSEISKHLAGPPREWNLYTFSGHGREQCLTGLKDSLTKEEKNFKRLHITSTRFNHQKALDLVKAHPKSVAIHGYNPKRGYDAGVICVGGKNKDQVEVFVSYVKANSSTFTDTDLDNYKLQPIDATDKDSVLCDGLEGTKKRNIVNRNSEGKGLQLELSYTMRRDLAEGTGQRYDTLRNIIYVAIEKAMGV